MAHDDPPDRFALWRRLDRPGHDAARLAQAADGWTLEGYAAFDENGATGLRYRVDLEQGFATRAALVEGHRGGRTFRHDFRRVEEDWILDRSVVPGLAGLVHLDFGFTPATNLQQLLHADLAIGQEAEIPAAWFDVGETTLVRLPQTYRRIAADRYHYRSPTAGYEATLELAPNGFARLYPGLWRMEGGA